MDSVSAYALHLVATDELDEKLRPPPRELRDAVEARLPLPTNTEHLPGRPGALAIDYTRRVRVPPPSGLKDPAQRIRILHAHANHELQAIELFAYALLAFPDTPDAFRAGCVQIIADEQRHLRLYMERLSELGSTFGALPVTAHFWRRVDTYTTPLRFICAMGMTYESANLDFALELARAADDANDKKTAKILRTVHEDEIRHVAFAWAWLKKWKRTEQTMWDAYIEHVVPPNGPERARGKDFDGPSRGAAGFSPEFVARLEATAPTRPGGAPR